VGASSGTDKLHDPPIAAAVLQQHAEYGAQNSQLQELRATAALAAALGKKMNAIGGSASN